MVAEIQDHELRAEALRLARVLAGDYPPADSNWSRSAGDLARALIEAYEEAVETRRIMETSWRVTKGAPLREHAARLVHAMRFDHEDKCSVIVVNLREARAQVATLTAERDEAQEANACSNREWLATAQQLQVERDEARREVERWAPVIEALRAFRKTHVDDPETLDDAERHLQVVRMFKRRDALLDALAAAEGIHETSNSKET